MEAIRGTHDIVGGCVTIRLPAGFAARRVEVIVLPAADDAVSSQRPHQRWPAPEMAGTIVRDDLNEPAVSADEWDALKWSCSIPTSGCAGWRPGRGR